MSVPTLDDLKTMEADLASQIDTASDAGALEDIRIAALGKKGSVSTLMKSLGGMSPEERR